MIQKQLQNLANNLQRKTAYCAFIQSHALIGIRFMEVQNGNLHNIFVVIKESYSDYFMD